MLPDRVSNPGPLTYESDALPIALRGPAADVGNLSQEALNIRPLISDCSIHLQMNDFRLHHNQQLVGYVEKYWLYFFKE